MNTKEKLDLIWKYLLLIIIAFGVFRMSGKPHHKRIKQHFDRNNHEMKVEVETEIVDGDTTIVIEVNGEEIELEDLNKIEGGFKWTSKDGKAIVIELDDDGKDEDEIRIIKRKIIIEDED